MKRASRRRGTLHVIGGLLIASAFLRAGTTGQAFALDAGAEPEVEMTSVPGPPAGSMQVAGDLDAVLRALQLRETRVAEREAQLLDRMQALKLAEEQVTGQLAELLAAEEALRTTIALADAAAETDLAQLTRVYENMKPKDAAELFQQMSPNFAAGFLGMMEPVSAAQIMTLMSAESAYSVSAVLAGRNAGVPTE